MMRAFVAWLFVRLTPQAQLWLVLDWAKANNYDVRYRKPLIPYRPNVLPFRVAVPRPALPVTAGFDRAIARAEKAVRNLQETVEERKALVQPTNPWPRR